MNDLQLEQFSRQILMSQWGIEAQQRVLASRVLVIGAGGLGCTLTQHLARAGVAVTVFDADAVERSNLHRQWYLDSQIGVNKAEALADLLAGIADVTPRPIRFDEVQASEFHDFDLWMDASDSLATRLVIHRAAQRYRRSWIMGSALAMSGQCAAFSPDSACFKCLFGDIKEPEQQCATSGVLGPVVAQVATTQALWALAYLGGVAALPVHRLRRWDGPLGDSFEMKFTKRTGCTCTAG